MLAAALVWQQRSSSGWWEVAVGAGGYKLSRVAPTGLYILTSLLYVGVYILTSILYVVVHIFTFSIVRCRSHFTFL